MCTLKQFHTCGGFCHPWLGSQLAFSFTWVTYTTVSRASSSHILLNSLNKNFPTPGSCTWDSSAQEAAGVLGKKEKVGRNPCMNRLNHWSFMSQEPSLTTFSSSEPFSIPVVNWLASFLFLSLSWRVLASPHIPIQQQCMYFSIGFLHFKTSVNDFSHLMSSVPFDSLSCIYSVTSLSFLVGF